VLLLACISIVGCYADGKFKDTNSQTYDTLNEFAETSPSCAVSEKIRLIAVQQSGTTEYIVSIDYRGDNHLVRMFKTHAVLGGYKMEGVSTDGIFKVNGSVNYLSNEGTDVMIKSLIHYSEGSLNSDTYKYCDL